MGIHFPHIAPEYAAQSLVWSGVVVVFDIFIDNSEQLRLMQYEQVIQALVLQTSQEPFTNRIRLRSPVGCLHLFDTCTGCNRRKQSALRVHKSHLSKNHAQ